MVALLVLATFVAFIAIDVMLHRDKYAFRIAEEPEPERARAMIPAPVVSGVLLPEGLSYHPGHTWALSIGQGRIRVGLDQFAASLLGSVQKVETPQRGRWLRQGEKGWTATGAKGAAVMLAPAEGEIVAVNERAIENPNLVADDPYGKGWLLEIFSPDAEVSFRNLLSGSFAQRWMEESMSELRAMFAPSQPVTALDGGTIVPKLGDDLTAEDWKEATERFFRS
jgi:glycine cleavage system H lipoate-binding protein